MKTTLNNKEYVTFARRFVKETVDQMDFEQLKSLVIDFIHEDLQKSYDHLGQTAVFENMSAWNCGIFDEIAEDYDLELEEAV